MRYILAALIILSSHSIFAQEGDPRLAELDERVQSETANLQALRSQQARLEKKLGELREQITALEKQETRMIDELASLREQEADAIAAIQDIKEREDRLEQLSLLRVRAMYMWGGRDAEIMARLVSSGADISRDALYLRKMRESDVALMHELSSLQALHEERRQELVRLSHEKETLYDGIQEQRKKLDTKLREQEAVSAELQKRKVSIERLLTSLKAEALRLEVVLRSMLVQAKSRTKHLKEEGSQGLASPYIEGPGIEELKDSLVWPAQGRLLRRYGEKATGSFEDFVFSNGVEIACTDGVEIGAVAGGKVAYVGAMAGFGRVVIIDHGKHWYSLYGRLGDVLVNRDELLGPGAPVAKCGRRDSDQSGLYLEIRRGSKPQDPMAYLRGAKERN